MIEFITIGLIIITVKVLNIVYRFFYAYDYLINENVKTIPIIINEKVGYS